MNILKGKYHFTELTEGDAEALLEERLELAEKGRLTPEEHVKSIASQPQLDMFEIRWNNIHVVDVDRVTGLYGDGHSAMVRLYYIEESGQDWIVGLHVHEKEIGDDDAHTNQLQNQEIDKAVMLSNQLQADNWWVKELENRT